MDSNTDHHETVLTSVVSTSPSVNNSTHCGELVSRHSLLAHRMSSVNRMSIPEHASATLTFHKINYMAGVTSIPQNLCLKCPKIPLFKVQEPKQVLFDVSGTFRNGMNAILGKSLLFTYIFQ